MMEIWRTSHWQLNNKISENERITMSLFHTLKIMEYFHCNMLNNNKTQNLKQIIIYEKDTDGKMIEKVAKKSRLHIEVPDPSLRDFFKQFKIEQIYLTLFDISNNYLQNSAIATHILHSWIHHGFHLYMANFEEQRFFCKNC